MFPQIIKCGVSRELLAAVLLLVLYAPAPAQSTAILQGRVVDSNVAVMPGVKIAVRNQATGVERIAQTDRDGVYQVAVLPVGVYRVEVRCAGFQTQIVERLIVEVGRTVTQDFQLSVGDISQ